MEINRVGVLGCGLMGSGIAQTAAAAGCEVIVREVTQDLCDRGFAGIEKSLAKFAEKGNITAEQQAEIRGRISGTTSLEDLKDCDLIIEAIVENLEAKRDTYNQLDALCKPETIFASNTSSLSITEMMTATRPERQARFVGLHFFNPVPLMKLVEVVRTILTDEEAYESAVEFGRKLGKVPVARGRQSGFIVNQPARPYCSIPSARRRGRRINRRHRQRHEDRLRPPDGAPSRCSTRRPRHDLLHRRDHVRRVRERLLRAAALMNAWSRPGLRPQVGRGSTNTPTRRTPSR